MIESQNKLQTEVRKWLIPLSFMEYRFGEVMIHRCSWLASPTLLPNEEGYFRGVSYLSLFHVLQVTQTQDRRRDG